MGNIQGVPEETWVSEIDASPYQPGAAVVVFDNHRRNDWTPYVYRTTSYGEDWTRLVDPDDVEGYTLSLVQDPEQRDLMFVGTELGLYSSVDRLREAKRTTTQIDDLLGDDWPTYRQAVTDTDISFFQDRDPIQMPSDEE